MMTKGLFVFKINLVESQNNLSLKEYERLLANPLFKADQVSQGFLLSRFKYLQVTHLDPLTYISTVCRRLICSRAFHKDRHPQQFTSCLWYKWSNSIHSGTALLMQQKNRVKLTMSKIIILHT